MSDRPIRRLILDFPHGATVRACTIIAGNAQEQVGARISEGGFQILAMPLTQEDDRAGVPITFSQDTQQYVFEYKNQEMAAP